MPELFHSHPAVVNRYISRLKHSLSYAIAISMKRNPQSPKSQFVRAIILVKGVHFYGFHSSYSPFLKVHLSDPAFVNRAVTILQSGTVMKTRFSVYESHLSFILQFMCDFGLYGCGWIDLSEVWQRGHDEEGSTDAEFLQATTRFHESPYFRQTRLPLEVDAGTAHILNRHRLSARNIHHTLTIPAPPLPAEPLVLSVRELWEDERRRRQEKGLTPSPEIPKDPSADSRGEGAAWVSEARWWDEIRKRIEGEHGREQLPPRLSWEKWVMTTFESVEALWEDEYKTWKPQLGVGEDAGGTAGSTTELNPFETSTAISLEGALPATGAEEDGIEVDVATLSSQALGQLVEREEADWNRIVDSHDDQDADRPVEEDYGVEVSEEGPLPLLPDLALDDKRYVSELMTPSPVYVTSVVQKTPVLHQPRTMPRRQAKK